VSDGGVLPRRTEDNCRKIRPHVIAFRARDELNDVGAHVNSSDTAMTTRPMSASEIRQAVIGISPKETCGMIAVCRRRSFGARTLSRRGRERRVTVRAAGRHVRACRPKVCAIEGSDGGALATPGGGVGSCGVDVRPPSDSENFKTKSPRRISPRGLCSFCDDGVMPVICPTCQSVFEWSTNCRQFDETVSTNCNGFGRLLS
jgi:hypothetical protein